MSNERDGLIECIKRFHPGSNMSDSDMSFTALYAPCDDRINFLKLKHFLKDCFNILIHLDGSYQLTGIHVDSAAAARNALTILNYLHGSNYQMDVKVRAEKIGEDSWKVFVDEHAHEYLELTDGDSTVATMTEKSAGRFIRLVNYTVDDTTDDEGEVVTEVIEPVWIYNEKFEIIHDGSVVDSDILEKYAGIVEDGDYNQDTDYCGYYLEDWLSGRYGDSGKLTLSVKGNEKSYGTMYIRDRSGLLVAAVGIDEESRDNRTRLLKYMLEKNLIENTDVMDEFGSLIL